MPDGMTQGCAICRAGVFSGHWSPPYLAAEHIAAHARLYHCPECGAWWEENEREAHVISDAEARRTFSEYFAARDKK